jgi:UDP-hydrolysing UDP-N-acetyl-D-glucosamine 2-epimerase
MSRRVLALTTSRADYGLLRPLLRGIDDHSDLELVLVVSGTHLSPRHGYTADEIESDGLHIAESIDLGIHSTFDSGSDAIDSLAKMSLGMAQALGRWRPDVLLVLGDRYEILAACSAALLLNVPIAHVHGGEVTNGSIDDAIRHSITKMATLHFPVHEAYAARLRQLGENSSDIVVIDPPVTETLHTFVPRPRQELTSVLGIELTDPVVALSYHPVTRRGSSSLKELEALLSALNDYSELTVVVTGTNADPHATQHQELLRQFVSHRPRQRAIVASLGHTNYLSLLKVSRCVIGNSSSGMIEAPLMGVHSISVGDRQKGRVVLPFVTQVRGNTTEIHAALDAVLANNLHQVFTPSKPNSVERVCDALAHRSLALSKEFVDL